jgi:hypothetical protein
VGDFGYSEGSFSVLMKPSALGRGSACGCVVVALVGLWVFL